MSENYFSDLYAVSVADKAEKKNGLSFLSWPFAWAELKKRHPEATYTVYENKDGFNYHTDGKTCWVKTGVTVNGIEHIEFLPVMDNRNQSLPLGNINSFAVNKAIQRSLTKAIARHGLGLSIYAGEDLPEDNKEEAQDLAVKLEEWLTVQPPMFSDENARKARSCIAANDVENMKKWLAWAARRNAEA